MNTESDPRKSTVRKLYKYTPFSTNLLSALVSQQVWYPKATSFNDPFDCTIIDFQKKFEIAREREIRRVLKRPTVSSSATKQDLEVTAVLQRLHDGFVSHRSDRDQRISATLAEIAGSLQSSLWDIGILCLSEDPKSILMWSHYASNHTGVCLEFERTKESKLAIDAKPVRYVKNRYAGRSADLFFDKFEGWAYEREWRLLENKGDMLYPFPAPLRSIVCGARMRSDEVAVIRNLISSQNLRGKKQVSLKIATMHHEKYSISIRSEA